MLQHVYTYLDDEKPELFYLLININIPYSYVTLNRQQTRLEDDKLPFGRGHKLRKSPRKPLIGVVEKGVNGAYQRIITVIYIILVRFPAVGRGAFVFSAYRHYTNMLLEGESGAISLVVEPIATNNADGIRSFLNVIHHFSRFVRCNDIWVGDGFSAKYGVFGEVHGARPLIVENHRDGAPLRAREDVAPILRFSAKHTCKIFNRDAGVDMVLVYDERQSVVCQLNGLRTELPIIKALVLFLLKITTGDNKVNAVLQQEGDTFALSGINGINRGLGIDRMEDLAFFVDDGTKTFVRGETNHP